MEEADSHNKFKVYQMNMFIFTKCWSANQEQDKIRNMCIHLAILFFIDFYQIFGCRLIATY